MSCLTNVIMLSCCSASRADVWAQGESTAGRASMLANMRYHTNVIISLFSALGSLAASSRKLMKTGAYALRIRQLEDIAAEIAAGASIAYVDGAFCA